LVHTHVRNPEKYPDCRTNLIGGGGNTDICPGRQMSSRSHWTSLALPAFVASAASTLSLQADILADCAVLDSTFLYLYLARWSSQFGDVPEVLPTKQLFWDRSGVLAEKALVEVSRNSPHSRASFLVACHQHSGDWLFSLPIASRGLN